MRFRILGGIVLSFFALIPGQRCWGNVIQNGSFEVGLGGWETNGTFYFFLDRMGECG